MRGVGDGVVVADMAEVERGSAIVVDSETVATVAATEREVEMRRRRCVGTSYKRKGVSSVPSADFSTRRNGHMCVGHDRHLRFCVTVPRCACLVGVHASYDKSRNNTRQVKGHVGKEGAHVSVSFLAVALPLYTLLYMLSWDNE